MSSNIKIIQPEEGEIWAVAGGNYRILVSGEETNGAYAIIEMIVPPGGGPPPHEHPEMQEIFYVTAGEMEFKTTDGKVLVKTGGTVNIPFNGGVHCFKNTSTENVRMTCTVIPAGLETLFREIGEPAALNEFRPVPAMTPERQELMKTLNEKYKQQFYAMDYLG